MPEFRKIRKKNPNFINLCLNKKLSSVITLQPLKRFDLDAAIIFSDILMVPYALNQTVNFKKNFGPKLEDFNLDSIEQLTDLQFKKKLAPIYQSIKEIRKNSLVKILAKGKILSPVKVTAHKFSNKARKEIESAGGEVNLILKNG